MSFSILKTFPRVFLRGLSSSQVFYTFAFTAQLIASIGLISIYVCFDQTMERRIIRYCNILLTFAFLCSTIGK